MFFLDLSDIFFRFVVRINSKILLLEIEELFGDMLFLVLKE